MKDVKKNKNAEAAIATKPMKNAKTNKLKKKNRFVLCLTMLVIAGIIGLVIAAVDFFAINPTQRSVSISMEFNYDGAAENQMPNDEPFTIDGIRTDEVIGAALAELGKQDKYSTESIRNSLSIMGVFPENVIDRISEYISVYEYINEETDEIKTTNNVRKSNYYPTAYSITLFDDFNTKASESEMEEILQKIVEKYREYFIKHYVYVYTSENTEEILSLEDLDYRLQLSYIRGKSDTLQSYAKQLYNKQPNFIYNGQNFNDFYVKCYDVERNILSRLEAVIYLKAYSKNPERLLNMYEYRLTLLNNQLASEKDKLTQLQTLIDSYELDDTLYIMGGENVVTIGSKAVGTYEDLTGRRINIENNITSINESIAKYQEYIDDIKKAQQDSSYLDTVKTDISTADAKVTALEKEFAEMVKAYNDYLVTAEDVVNTETYFNSPKIISGSFIKRVIKYAMPLCLITFAMFCIVMIVDEKKRVKA